MTAIYVALVIYMVVLFGVGLFYSKKNATINDFLLAGRDLGVVAATLTVTASLFGGGLLTGSAQYAYDSGPMMYVYGIVGSGGGLLLAALLVHKMKDFSNYGTITQYLEARYGSRFLRTGSAILSMIALISIVGSQVAAVVGIMNALGMKNTTLAAVLAMVVIIALTSMGGLKAVTVTDGFQIILVIIGVIWVTVVALGDVGGFAGLNSALQSMTSELPTDYNVFTTPAHFKTLLWMILPGFMYVMIGQDIYQRLVVVSQIFTVVAGAAAVVVSMTIPSILDACFNAYYIFTAGVFCPIVFGVFWKKTTKQGAIAGLVAGGVFVMFALSTGFNIAGIGGELLSGILSAIVLVVVSLATQPKEIARA